MLVIYQRLFGGATTGATVERHWADWCQRNTEYIVWMVPGTFDDEGRPRRWLFPRA